MKATAETHDPRVAVMTELNKVLGLMEDFSSQQPACLEALEQRLLEAQRQLEQMIATNAADDEDTEMMVDQDCPEISTEHDMITSQEMTPENTRQESTGVEASPNSSSVQSPEKVAVQEAPVLSSSSEGHASSNTAAGPAQTTGNDGPLLSSEQASSLQALFGDAKKVGHSVFSKHRELHTHISKVGKAIDKSFDCTFDYLRTSTPFIRTETRPLLQEAICNHLCRSGMQAIADQIVQESENVSSSQSCSAFAEIYTIVSALRDRDLTPLHEWVAAHKEELDERKSPLEFKLRHMQFINKMIEEPTDVAGAIEFARTYLQPYVHTHQKTITQAMGTLVFKNSRQELLNPEQWDDLRDMYVKDACKLAGLSLNSPLSLVVKAGCVALPSLINIRFALSDSQAKSFMESSKELPIHIDLGPGCQFHSIFSCPIMRMQSNEQNPPMKLLCGHVISKDALNRFATGSKKASGRIKCPYCPQEQDPKETMRIYF